MAKENKDINNNEETKNEKVNGVNESVSKNETKQETTKKKTTRKPKKKTGKDLTKNIGKLDKKLSQTYEEVVEIDGDEYVIEYDRIFRKSKQRELIKDMVVFIDEMQRQNAGLELLTGYIGLLTLKHFTSLDVPDNVEDAIHLFNVLVDLEVMEDMLNNLQESELEKLYKLLEDTMNKVTENIEEANKEAEKLYDELENDEVKDMVDDGGDS